jgi:2-polyprenyl-3-methyl-5-hydroxy-6-metoxy-1,4-benzoquinol methylase
VNEQQYDVLAEYQRHSLGLMSSHTYEVDSKRLGFTLARYKFVAKVLAGADCVLEVGCGDGFATRVVAQSVGNVMATDFDEAFIADACSRHHPVNVTFQQHDMVAGSRLTPSGLQFDAAYAMDVLEHIRPEHEGAFLGNVALSIGQHGTFVCGMPSLESQPHASDLSKAGHVNCKTEAELRATLKRYWRNVFVFGMNDETLHTGFGPMCHYRLAICTGAKL